MWFLSYVFVLDCQYSGALCQYDELIFEFFYDVTAMFFITLNKAGSVFM